MKTFLAAWFGTLILGWGALNLFGALFGSWGLMLLGVTGIALLAAILASLSEEVDQLKKRLERLVPPEGESAAGQEADRAD